MPNTMRWRYGDTNPVVLPVESDIEVLIGDLVYLDPETKAAFPASSLHAAMTVDGLRGNFHRMFAGVAM